MKKYQIKYQLKSGKNHVMLICTDKIKAIQRNFWKSSSTLY
jgi:hypothetical protein